MIMQTVGSLAEYINIYAKDIQGTEVQSTEEASTAANVIQTGTVKSGAKNVRIRTSPDTSSTANVITKVNAGFKLDILDTVKVSDTYIWYKVAFYLNGVYKMGYISGEYVVIDTPSDYDENGDFEAYLNSQNFPESYKAGLREIHKKYPKWVFVADHVSNDWNEVVKQQNVLGRSLISKNSISSWKSIADGCYDWEESSWYTWDGGSWVQASSELIEYTLDPRNFLNETNIFMFEKLSYNSAIHNTSGVENVIDNSFMETSSHELTFDGKTYTYAEALMYAGQVSKVSPYHLATRIIQEQGTSGTGKSISGTVAGYEGYYNYFNIGASAGTTGNPITNGLIYAAKDTGTYLRPWNSRMKSLLGGAVYLGEKYISVGQDTIYYEKFDLVNYWHQYMTHVLAPRSESVKSSKAYTEEMKKNTPLVFYIPVYKNMPAEVCKEPTVDGSPNNTLSALSVGGYSLTPSFDRFTQEYDLIVDNSVASINVSATKAESTAKVEGAGNKTLAVGSNRIEIVVTAGNGDKRTYVINVVREAGVDNPPTEAPTQKPTEKPTETPTQPKEDLSYSMGSYKVNGGIIAGFAPGNTFTDIKKNITLGSDVTAKLLTSSGAENTGKIATGNRIVLYKNDGSELAAYNVVVYGDVNGDGDITSIDMLYVKRHILNTKALTGVYATAADANRAADGITSIDLLYIKRHVLNTRLIVQ